MCQITACPQEAMWQAKLGGQKGPFLEAAGEQAASGQGSKQESMLRGSVK